MSRRPFSVAALVLLDAVLAGCGGFAAIAPSPTGSPGFAERPEHARDGFATRPATPMYVYVADRTAGAVLRYPITYGIVASQPSSILRVPIGPSNAYGGLAVAPDGTLFVSVGYGSPSKVNVYAPGATGEDRPVRAVLLPKSGYTYGAIAVDANGYLYWQMDSGMNVYAPGAHGEAKPIQTIADFGFYVALDAAGNLYISNDNTGVDEWSNPITSPTLVRRICLKDQAEGVAVAASGEAYVVADDRIDRLDVIRFFRPEDGCPAPRQWYFRSEPPFELDVRGPLAEYNGSLFLIAGETSLFQLPETGPRRRTALAVLSGLPLRTPNAVAVGP